MATSTTPTTTEENIICPSGPVACWSSIAWPGHAALVAGKSVNSKAWLFVDIIPRPAHGAVSLMPVLPSQGVFRTSM